ERDGPDDRGDTDVVVAVGPGELAADVLGEGRGRPREGELDRGALARIEGEALGRDLDVNAGEAGVRELVGGGVIADVGHRAGHRLDAREVADGHRGAVEVAGIEAEAGALEGVTGR